MMEKVYLLENKFIYTYRIREVLLFYPTFGSTESTVTSSVPRSVTTCIRSGKRAKTEVVVMEATRAWSWLTSAVTVANGRPDPEPATNERMVATSDWTSA